MAASVQLRILGGYSLRIDGQDVSVLPRKTRALLAYLALHPSRPVAREYLGEVLWSDRGAEQANHSLRQALVDLRQRFRGHDVVAARDGGLLLGSDVTTDVAALLTLNPASDPAATQRAADAYIGKLLDGFPPVSRDFDDWLALTRGQLETTVLSALAGLADMAANAGQPAQALTATERMFEIDPLREDIHRRLLLAFAAAGRRSEALRHYATIVELLHRELGVTPGRETRELAQRLRREMAPVRDEAALAATAVPARPGGVGEPPVAVLPFRQIGDEPLPSHLRDGLVADIVCQLSGLRELSVISHGSTAGLDPDVRAASQLLGARYIVTGSMRRLGPDMRLTAELADAGSGTVIWAETHDTQAAISFKDQDILVGRIVSSLAPRVHEVELRRIRGKRPESLTVYEKILLAREHLESMDYSRFLAARQFLTEATEAEPGYAEPFALLADFHGLVAAEGLSDNREADIAEVERLTRRALELDRDNVRALVSYAHRKSLLRRDYVAARELFRRALDISPNAAQGWLWSSLMFSWLGETNEALRRAYRALELSPRDREAHKFYTTICTAHYTAGNYREAAEWGVRALGERSVMRGAYRWTAASFAALGQGEQARDIMRQCMQQVPNQRVSDVVRVHPYQDAERRQKYGEHLVAAGFPV